MPTNLLGKTTAIVAFRSVAGGTGCTMLAAHFGTFAAECDVPTLAVSLDRGHMFRMLAGDATPTIDGYEETRTKNLFVAYCPIEDLREMGQSVAEYLPNFGLPFSPEIVVVDLGPGQAEQAYRSAADIMVVPVSDSRGLYGLETGNYPQGKLATLFVPNQVGLSALHSVASGSRWTIGVEIPRSRLIARAMEQYQTVWQLSRSDNITTRRLVSVCERLLSLIIPDASIRAIVRKTKRDASPPTTGDSDPPKTEIQGGSVGN